MPPIKQNERNSQGQDGRVAVTDSIAMGDFQCLIGFIESRKFRI